MKCVDIATNKADNKDMKTCIRCGIEKADEDFWGRYCLSCRKIRAKEYYNQNREIIRKKAHVYYKANREAILESQREYNEINAERHRERSREYYKNNRDKVRAYCRANKEHINELCCQSVKRRRVKVNEYKRSLPVTPKDKLNKSMRNGISRSIIRGGKAGRSWKSLVGYTANELKAHLEKQFTKEMTWENYGAYWHVDHIVPKAAFNFEKAEDIDFKRCWELKNLRPLEAKENLKKGARLLKHFQPALLLGN